MSQSIEHKETVTKFSHTKELALCALMCAVLIVSSFITVPFGPVPFTLQTFALPLIILLFSPKRVAETVGLYLVMGAIGLPVFSGMQGGIGHILGPTGGFLISYFIGGVIASALRCKIYKKTSKQPISDFISLAVFLVICYFFGWAWLMIVAHISPLAAFTAAVIPFIFIDIFKYIAAFAVAKVIRLVLKFD